MFMEKAMDSGNVIYVEKIDIEDSDNLATLFTKWKHLLIRLFITKLTLYLI